jgi:hypothetical protein
VKILPLAPHQSVHVQPRGGTGSPVPIKQELVELALHPGHYYGPEPPVGAPAGRIETLELVAGGVLRPPGVLRRARRPTRVRSLCSGSVPRTPCNDVVAEAQSLISPRAQTRRPIRGGYAGS